MHGCCLRNYKAILLWGQEVEFERMADAAWAVDGCDISHGEGSIALSLVESSRSKVGAVGVDDLGLSDVFRHESCTDRGKWTRGGSRRGAGTFGTLELFVARITFESHTHTHKWLVRQAFDDQN